MSKHILASFENSSSSFRCIKNIHLSADFYDTIYVGRFFSRYSVLYNNQPYYAYVLKSENLTTSSFKDAATIISGIKHSPFPSFELFDKELLSYEDTRIGVYYDIVLARRVDGVKLFDITTIAALNFDVLQSFTKGFVWLIRNQLSIGGFDSSQIYIVNGKVVFDFNYRNNLIKDCLFDLNFFQNLAIYLLSLYLICFNREDKLLTSNTLNFLANDLDKDSLLEELKGIRSKEVRDLVEFYINGGDRNELLRLLESFLALDCKDAESLFARGDKNIDFYDSRLYEIISDKPCEQRIIVRDRKSGKYGFIDCNGNPTSDTIYDSVEEYYESISVVTINGEAFVIDNYGKTLFRNGYTSLEWLGEVNRFIAKSRGVYILLSRVGEVVCDRGYVWIGEFSYGRAAVETNTGLKGYIDVDGEEIIAAIYDDIASFDDGVGRVLFEDNWYSVTLDGVLIKEVEI